MNRKTLLSIGSALFAMGVISAVASGCGDDDDAVTTKTDSGTPTPESSTPETGTPDTGTKNPAPPTLGAQIDRMGRPAVNTALNNVFNPDATTQGQAKDKYNQNTDQANWSKTFVAETSKNLAIFDGVDTICGNSFLTGADAGLQNLDAGSTAVYNNLQVYGVLGGVTADDRLWLDTNGATCNTYLAVEGQATGIIPNTDCGGRALKYDVIDITYSAVSKGTISGVTDGIDADPIKTAATAFPFLSDPK